MAYFGKMKESYKRIAMESQDKAKALVDRAMQQLAMNPPKQKYQELLRDCFDIGVGEWAGPAASGKAMQIRDVLSKVRTFMANTTIRYVSNPPAAAQGFAAYTIPGQNPREIFITHSFVHNYTLKERAAYLAHEYIHLAHWPHGHPGPGGEHLAVSFGQSTLGIPFNDAMNNAYCYQYFIEWMA